MFDPTGFIEIGWWIAKRFWGQGYATEAARCALEHAFRKIRILHLKSFANPGNKAYIAVMYKIGFQQKMSGFLGNYLRSPNIYQLLHIRWTIHIYIPLPKNSTSHSNHSCPLLNSPMKISCHTH